MKVGIIIDESAKIKNPGAKLTKCFFKLSDMFSKKIILTGTPVANRPYDLWSQIYFLDKGKSLGESFEDFNEETDIVPKLLTDEKELAEYQKILSEIFEKIEDFSIRETKKSGNINLPEKNLSNRLSVGTYSAFII